MSDHASASTDMPSGGEIVRIGLDMVHTHDGQKIYPFTVWWRPGDAVSNEDRIQFWVDYHWEKNKLPDAIRKTVGQFRANGVYVDDEWFETGMKNMHWEFRDIHEQNGRLPQPQGRPPSAECRT